MIPTWIQHYYYFFVDTAQLININLINKINIANNKMKNNWGSISYTFKLAIKIHTHTHNISSEKKI